MDINSVVLVGRLTQQPELRHTPTGTPYCKFSLALNHYYKSKDGQRVEEVSFFNCVAWTGTAEALVKYGTKGKQIGVTGRLNQNRWVDSNEQKRSTVEIVVSTMQLLSSPGERSSASTNVANDGSYSRASEPENNPVDDYGNSNNDYSNSNDDDIPF